MNKELSANSTLSHYRIVSKIGAGGMGEVYLAEDTRLHREVALKILPADLAFNQDRMRRFEQEAKAAAALNHPNIAHIYEIGESAGTNFIAMEFIDGVTLRRRMNNAPMTLNEVLDVAPQIASALGAAHAAGIVHRDIKPENVMLRHDGIAKLLDFGLAKLPEQAPPKAVDTEAPTRAAIKTEPGVVLGTAIYMSPEQARGMSVDARTDIFSLGVLIYEMVAGRLPFEGSNTNEILASILSDKEPLRLARYAREAPAELERIVSKTLRKNRDERYQTIKDMLLDLQTLKTELEFERKLERSAPPRSKDAYTVQPTRAETATEAPALPTERATSAITVSQRRILLAVGVLLVAALGVGGYLYLAGARSGAIDSLAVMTFVNESGNSDVEYLSDGMTESLINSLSQLPHLSVKARSSVFRYKGKEVDPQQVASQLSVQAILTGRMVQRGDQLTLYLSLVDGRNGNQIWGDHYDRKMPDLISLQSEIARDVATKLRLKLSSPEEQKLAKSNTANTEAYQLYLKGRYQVLKQKRSETQKGVAYFQQAIEVDPSYALAYVGLAEANRALALSGEMNPMEYMPKAKAAAQKAIDIDDTLSEAHSALGFIIMWYDWDWNEAQNQCKRALELNPNSADSRLAYAHLLSNTGRHAEALAEARRARELEPLNLRTNTLEGQFLIHAGRVDEGLERLQKTLELDSNYWFAHAFAASAYIEKGMFAEAVAEAQKARDFSEGNAQPFGFLGYALAKSGKQAEARGVLEELLKLSTERYVPQYWIAMIYSGLGEREQAFTSLERAYKERDPRMTFLKVEPKWNNLGGDPRFHALLKKVGFTD